MDRIGELTSFRIVELNYHIQPGFRGQLHVDERLAFAMPEEGAATQIRSQLQIQIQAEDPAQFALHITGEGIFLLPEQLLEQAMAMAPAVMDPLAEQMEERTVQSVETITRDFGIAPVRLKAER